jgi:hypothetical protein
MSVVGRGCVETRENEQRTTIFCGAFSFCSLMSYSLAGNIAFSHTLGRVLSIMAKPEFAFHEFA